MSVCCINLVSSLDKCWTKYKRSKLYICSYVAMVNIEMLKLLGLGGGSHGEGGGSHGEERGVRGITY